MDCQVLTNGAILCAYTYGVWIQTGAIVVSAFAALGLFQYTIVISKRRATIDLVLQQKVDPRLVKAEEGFYPLLREHRATRGNSFTKYLSESDSEENKFILYILNTHEFAAAGVREGAFDEKTYKRMLCSQVIMDWDALEGYILELRKLRDHPTLFKEFEWLAKKWKANPLAPG